MTMKLPVFNKGGPKSPVSGRRRFLGYRLGLLGSVFAAGIIGPVLGYLQTPSKKKKGEVVKLFAAGLPAGGVKCFFIRGGPGVAVNAREGYAAFSLVCSQLG